MKRIHSVRRLSAVFACLFLLGGLLCLFPAPAHAAGGLDRIYIGFNHTLIVDVSVDPSMKGSDAGKDYHFDNSETYYDLYVNGETVNGITPTGVTLDGVTVTSDGIVQDVNYPYTTQFRMVKGVTGPDGTVTLRIKVTDLRWDLAADYQPVYMEVRYFIGDSVRQATFYYSGTPDKAQHINDNYKDYQGSDGDQLAWFSAETVTMSRSEAEVVVTISLDGPAGPAVQEQTHSAETDPGEDVGTEIRPEIVEKPDRTSTLGKIAVSVGGALTAVGAIGASSGGEKDGSEEEKKKKKTYRMKVYKNFGDGLRRGAEPEHVWARIVEVTEAGEINRPDLSEKITVSGTNMNVKPAGMNNTYTGAEISVPAGTAAEKATLTFSFTGEGGVFRNNLVFRILGDPEIVFPALSEDGKEWILSGPEEPVVLIAGAGGTEKVLFLLENAPGEPKNIRFRTEDGFDVTHEKFPGSPFAYYAVIKNNSAPVEKQSGVFGEKRTVAVDITAEFSGGATAENRFSFELYPEGLTVLYSRGLANDLLSRRPGIMSPKLQDGRLEVISYTCFEGFDDKIPFTDADICYAWKDAAGKGHATDDGRYFTCDPLQPTDEVTQLILEKYNCFIAVGNGMLTIRPKDSLPEPDEPRFVSLPVSVSVDGHTDRAEIPLRLLGVKLDKPSKEWQTEYNLLRKTVIRSFPDDYEPRLRSVEEVYGEPGKFDPSELRIARYEMLRTSIEYWEREKGYQKEWEELYDFADSYRKVFRQIADFAFSMVVKYYAGDHEAWITPCKDVVVDCVDEALWSYYNNGKFEASVTDKVTEQAVKALENVIDNFIGVEDPVNFRIAQNEQKKLFFALVAFVTVDWTKTYYKMDPKDFWESWRTTWINLSTMAIKKLAGVGISKVMSSKKIEEFFDSRLMQEINKALPGQAKGKFKPMFLPQEAREFVKGGNVDLSAIREGVWTATNAAGRKVSAELTDMVFFGYRDVLENALNALLGEGIGKVMDKTGKAIKESAEFGMLYLPVKASWFDMEGEDAMISVNLIKLFTSPAGIASTVYNSLFTMLFGPVYPMLQGMFMPEDPGKAVLNKKTP